MTKKCKAILFFGAPGSGKGTQGKMLGNLFGFCHIACGDVFRALDKNSELGRIFAEYAGQGRLVPDEFTVRLWEDHLERVVAARKFNPETDTLVLDGIPRNVPQAKMLAARIAVQQIIVLRVEHDLDDIVHRMQLRAQREGRLDDANETVIRHRFEVYEQETKPVLDYYPASLRIEVNGIQAGPVHVAHDVLAGLIGRRAEMLPIPR